MNDYVSEYFGIIADNSTKVLEKEFIKPEYSASIDSRDVKLAYLKDRNREKETDDALSAEINHRQTTEKVFG